MMPQLSLIVGAVASLRMAFPFGRPDVVPMTPMSALAAYR